MILGFISTDTWWFTWLALPFLIFLARVADQSMGTLRLVFVAKGFKYLAPVVGFIESIIWLLAVSQILKHTNNLICIVAYGLGFSLGGYFGMLLEEKLSLGRVIVRVVATKQTDELIEAMRDRQFGLTLVDGHGSNSQVKLIFSVLDRKHINDLVAIIKKWNPSAFYSIEEVKVAREGVFKPGTSPLAMMKFGLRKAK